MANVFSEVPYGVQRERKREREGGGWEITQLALKLCSSLPSYGTDRGKVI